MQKGHINLFNMTVTRFLLKFSIQDVYAKCSRVRVAYILFNSFLLKIILQVAARKSREKRLSGIDQLKAEKRAKHRTLLSIRKEKEIKARENDIMERIFTELGE